MLPESVDCFPFVFGFSDPDGLSVDTTVPFPPLNTLIMGLSSPFEAEKITIPRIKRRTAAPAAKGIESFPKKPLFSSLSEVVDQLQDPESSLSKTVFSSGSTEAVESPNISSKDGLFAPTVSSTPSWMEEVAPQSVTVPLVPVTTAAVSNGFSATELPESLLVLSGYGS